MTNHSSVPSAGWVTRSRRKFRDDPFFAARLTVAVLVFVASIAIILLAGRLNEWLVLAPLSLSSLSIRFLPMRLLSAVALGLIAYLLADIAFGPVRRSAELQRRFIANVSHELRTPLAVAKNATEVALRKGDALTREDAIALLKSNLEETDRLTDLIKFMLAFADFESLNHTLLRPPLYLDAVLERIAARYQPEAHAAGCALLYAGLEHASVLGNAVALEQVFSNLVRNALTHTGKGGVIRISIEERKDLYACTVKDTGVGIAKEDLPHVFDPFFRGKNAGHEGVGLGLSIVREIVRLHEGTIDVESIEGEGTTFTVLLPKLKR